MVIIPIITQTCRSIGPSSLIFMSTPLHLKSLSLRKSTLHILPRIPPPPYLQYHLLVLLLPHWPRKIPLIYPGANFITTKWSLNLSQLMTILKMTCTIAHFSSLMNLPHFQTSSLSNQNILFTEVSIGSKNQSQHLKPLKKVTWTISHQPSKSTFQQNLG